MHYDFFTSPIGTLLLVAREEKLVQLVFPNQQDGFQAPESWCRAGDFLTEVKRQLQAYFSGTRRDFELALLLNGTSFQKRVWEVLATVPYGSTTTYGELAAAIGNPKASRAVGMANARNPIPIIIPCHRVIGKNGTLTGFGGGLETKKALLQLEGIPC